MKPDKLKILRPLALALLCLPLTFNQASARGEPVAVLDFEVKDLTMNPAIEDEQERAAKLRPLMQTALADQHGYDVKEIDPEVQRQADKGVGYLYDKPALVAELGKQVGADWVVVGRVHKPTYLFVYFKALIVNVQTGRIVSEQIIEVKGPPLKFTKKGVEALSVLIDEDIQKLAGGS